VASVRLFLCLTLCLLVVVWLPFEDGVCSIQLFQGKRPDHLVRKCHRSQAPLFVGEVANAGVKSIWSPDDPSDVFQAANLKLFNVLRKSDGAVRLSVFVQKHKVINTLEVLVQNFGLLLHNPLRVRLPRAGLDIDRFDELKTPVMIESFCIFDISGLYPGRLRFSNGDERHLHATKLGA